MSAEYPGAEWSPIPGFGFPTGSHGGNAPRWIVLHGTSSNGATAQNIASYFAGDNQNGTHFVIGKDGTVIQMVALHDAAYGNGGPTAQELAEHKYADFWQAEIDAGVNLNTVTISIEHCKDSGNSEDLTPAQQDASFKLVAWLCKTLNIPARPADANGGVTGHFSINGIERVNCPGPYPWDALFSYLGGSTMPTGPFYKVITGQNGVPTVGNEIAAAVGLTWQEIVAIPGQDAKLAEFDPTGPYMVGFPLLLPGFPPPAPVDNTLQQRLDEAVKELTDAKQQLALLTQQEPTDPVALQQRMASALETIAADVHQLQRLIPPSAPQLS